MMRRRRLRALWPLLGLLFPLAASASEPPPVVEFGFLSGQLSMKLAITALEACEAQGYAVSVAVMNREGRLSSFVRSPLASPMTGEIAQGKAYTSALTQAATHQLEGAEGVSYAQGVVPVRGGMPIQAAGRFYGGIGVSGAPSSVDLECAQAGMEAVQEELEFLDF